MNKEITVRNCDDYCNIDEEELTLNELIKWLNGEFNKVPSEFRDTATIELSGVSEYNCGALGVEIKYTRELTKEEIDAVNHNKDIKRRAIETRELNVLSALQEKYRDRL